MAVGLFTLATTTSFGVDGLVRSDEKEHDANDSHRQFAKAIEDPPRAASVDPASRLRALFRAWLSAGPAVLRLLRMLPSSVQRKRTSGRPALIPGNQTQGVA